MKKLIGLMLVVMLAVALLGCEEMVENKPLEPNVPVEVPEEPIEDEPVEDEPIEEPVEDEPVEDEQEEPVEEEPEEETPVEDEQEEPEEETPETPEDTVTLHESSGENGVWKTIILDTKDYNTMKITIKGESAYDIPVNINKFKINGAAAEYTEVTGTRYLLEHEFKIGNFRAVGNLINTHKFEDVVDLRLHSWHKDHGTDGYITIDLEEIDSLEFSFTVTTNAFAYLDGLQIELSK